MLKSWFKGRRKAAVEYPEVSPDSELSIIGDLHGCTDLLARALDRIPSERQIICVGDYVDRGEDSSGVLKLLVERDDVICLRGNHEEMLQSFLDEPEAQGPRWLKHGGLQTLASFGVSGITQGSKDSDLLRARDTLKEAMGPEMIAWLAALPLTFRSGNVAVVHAAMAPAMPIERQKRRHLLWGSSEFGKVLRTDGLWVAHGHTIVSDPVAEQGVISVDTGAYATGRLTIANVRHGQVNFEIVT